MPEMSFEDVISRFKDTLVMYGSTPVYVEKVLDDETVSIVELETGISKKVAFSLDKFKAPPRIGMVNIDDGVIYVERQPARMYKVGMDKNNLVCVTFDKFKYRNGEPKARARISSLRAKEIANAIKGRYPTFKQAVKLLRQFDGAVAFDKQFALTSTGEVLYKGLTVGKWTVGAQCANDIEFKEHYKYLANLVDKDYENCFATSRCS